ncbi:MAG: hypothetical protein KDA29_09680 [Phycisphaerales bacterium]|nr:hypothetical protein [Phycisphaerales bacterium]
MGDAFQNITSNSDSFIMFLIFVVGGGVGGIVALTAIVLGTRQNVRIAHEQEMSRREIAAYIAEGSMSPEDGERLLNAGKSAKKC